MKNIKIYFENTEKHDIAKLKELLNEAGCQTVFIELENDDTKDNAVKAMGFEEILALLISSGTLVALATSLQIWLKNRKTTILIEKENEKETKRAKISTTQLKTSGEILDSLKEILVDDNNEDS